MKIFNILLITLAFLAATTALAGPDKQRDLPPGLQKKVERGGELPPGWERKLAVGETLDREVYEKGRVVYEDDDGLVAIRMEGKLIKVMENTREIVEILSDL